jgi:hypothetical protein
MGLSRGRASREDFAELERGRRSEDLDERPDLRGLEEEDVGEARGLALCFEDLAPGDETEILGLRILNLDAKLGIFGTPGAVSSLLLRASNLASTSG